jgi:hypothetical protein
LADESQRLGRVEDRERFWLLAADAAMQAGNADEAEKLRRQILAHNPNYFLRPYENFAAAAKTPDIQKYIQDLRKHYPPAQAERWLQSLRGQAQQPTVDPAGLATLQPKQALPRPAPPPAAPPAKSPGVFDMEPRRPEGPKAPTKADFKYPQTGKKRRKPRELQPGAWVGVVLFVVVLFVSVADVIHQFVLPVVQGR